jgi:hypothetical protein
MANLSLQERWFQSHILYCFLPAPPLYRECDSTHVHDDKCICGKVLVENSKECDFETTAPEDSDSPSGAQLI